MTSRTIRFANGFNGELLLDEGSVKIGRGAGEAAPYDMLYGALASCLYATFSGILEKKRIEIKGAGNRGRRRKAHRGSDNLENGASDRNDSRNG